MTHFITAAPGWNAFYLLRPVAEVEVDQDIRLIKLPIAFWNVTQHEAFVPDTYASTSIFTTPAPRTQTCTHYIITPSGDVMDARQFENADFRPQLLGVVGPGEDFHRVLAPILASVLGDAAEDLTVS